MLFWLPDGFYPAASVPSYSTEGICCSCWPLFLRLLSACTPCRSWFRGPFTIWLWPILQSGISFPNLPLLQPHYISNDSLSISCSFLLLCLRRCSTESFFSRKKSTYTLRANKNLPPLFPYPPIYFAIICLQPTLPWNYELSNESYTYLCIFLAIFTSSI